MAVCTRQGLVSAFPRLPAIKTRREHSQRSRADGSLQRDDGRSRRSRRVSRVFSRDRDDSPRSNSASDSAVRHGGLSLLPAFRRFRFAPADHRSSRRVSRTRAGKKGSLSSHFNSLIRHGDGIDHLSEAGDAIIVNLKPG